MNQINTEIVRHEFDPVFDENSKILILGTIPSPKSREQGFYYGHPRNRFWRVIADLCNEPFPETVTERKELALRRNIAIWDVLASCEIHGADDGSIKHPEPNDMDVILKKAHISAIFTTGAKAAALYHRYCFPKTGISAIKLTSTSPANCRISYDEIRMQYSVILDYL